MCSKGLCLNSMAAAAVRTNQQATTMQQRHVEPTITMKSSQGMCSSRQAWAMMPNVNPPVVNHPVLFLRKLSPQRPHGVNASPPPRSICFRSGATWVAVCWSFSSQSYSSLAPSVSGPRLATLTMLECSLSRTRLISYTSPTPLATGAANTAFQSNLCTQGSPVLDGLPACSAAGFPSYAVFPPNPLVPIASLGYNSDPLQFVPSAASAALAFGVEKSVVAPWSFDDMVLLQWVTRFSLLDNVRLKQSDYYTVPAAIGSSGYLYFAPDTPAVQALVTHFNTTTNLFKNVFGQVFTTVGDAEAYVKATDREGTSWGIIVVNSLTASNFDVEIRLNHTAMPETSSNTDKYYRGGTTESNTLYILNGFYTLQNIISKYYIENVANVGSTVNEPYVAPMGYSPYEDQSFLAFGGQLAPLIIVLGFLYPVSQLAKRLVLEKERRIREAMMIMGLSNFAFYFSWIVVYVGQHLITSIIILIILKKTYLPNANTGALFFCFFFFQLSTITLSGFISSFFSKSRIAALLTPLIYFVLSIPLFAITSANSGAKGILLILSPTAFAEGIQLLFDGELGGGLGTAQLKDDNPSMIAVLVLLFIDFVVYFLLWMWIDAIMPNEWGTPRSVCFCITDLFKCCFGCGRTEGQDDNMPDGR
ncbi:ABC transporter, putative [Bodo saltans]|uniref:ABC transporter, putative n=1 Tax=Bodo saltans TaxID=75058 RepID=A0A0S4KKP1_BODSA|nr:ABC transporter, putative [Bodo saltans]|eukprot:CUM57952.1 ABC transporter, putative [Bodo saltans]